MKGSEVNLYVGLSWALGARGPASFDCWGLLIHVQRAHFGVSIPDIPSFGDPARQMYEREMQAGRWALEKEPFHGAGVLLRGGNDPHVGVWLDIDGGGVLHSMRGAGVVWADRAVLRAQGFSRLSFYRLDASDPDPLPEPLSRSP